MKWWVLLLVASTWGLAVWAAYTAVRQSMARRWPAVPCVGLGSRVEEVGGEYPYLCRVAYEYRWNRIRYNGRTYREKYRGSQDVAEADRLARAYPAGSSRVCY